VFAFSVVDLRQRLDSSLQARHPTVDPFQHEAVEDQVAPEFTTPLRQFYLREELI
jgi:hypothetical protein